jgi:hypothetical protein
MYQLTIAQSYKASPVQKICRWTIYCEDYSYIDIFSSNCYNPFGLKLRLNTHVNSYLSVDDRRFSSNFLNIHGYVDEFKVI